MQQDNLIIPLRNGARKDDRRKRKSSSFYKVGSNTNNFIQNRYVVQSNRNYSFLSIYDRNLEEEKKIKLRHPLRIYKMKEETN